MLGQERLKDLLSYDPETGLFYWRVDPPVGPKRAGKRAGYLHSLGYILIRIKGRDYPAGRLAWLWMTSQWPQAEIDHIDGDKTNNRFVNLREATRQENCRNRIRQKNNKSGFKGVSTARNGRYRARVTVSGKEIYIGGFCNPSEAHAAYLQWAGQLFGEFGRET
jgi:hypothetical protein